MSNKPIAGNDAINGLMKIAQLPKSVAVEAYNSAMRLHKMQQMTPPAKGVFVSLPGNEINKSLLDLEKRILKVVSQRAARNPDFKGLYDFEAFQSGQKGPVQKVTGERVVESVDTIVENSSEEICSAQGLSLLDKASQLLRSQLIQEGLKGIIKANDIAPVLAWSSMNHSSKRGLPGLQKGNNVFETSSGKIMTIDDAIERLYGNDMHHIVGVVEQMRVVVGVIGLRLQGVAVPDPAKVRIIFMPEIPEQYALRAVQYRIQNKMKELNTQMGYAGADPEQYKINMTKAMEGQNSSYYYLSLDYSKYDTRSSYHVRNLAFSVLIDVLLDDNIEGKSKLINKICDLGVNQYMLAPDSKGTASVFHVPNLLTSGDVFTQLLGNTMNRMYQYAISIALGYNLDRSLGLELGDDTVLPVPISIVDRLGGYQKLLETVEKIIETGGSKMNIKKQYPDLEASIFLQRLYKYDSHIEGEYSLIRALNSLVGAERPREPIQGVKNLDALETIGQLGLLNLISTDGGKVTNKDLLAKLIIPGGLSYDKALLALAQDALSISKGDPEFAGGLVFSYLVKAVGGISSVADGLDIKSYDQYGMTQILRTKHDLTRSLPVLSTLCIVAKTIPTINFDYRNIYKVETKVHPQILSDYLSEQY